MCVSTAFVKIADLFLFLKFLNKAMYCIKDCCFQKPIIYSSVEEQEPAEPKLFCGTRAETGAINYFGSGSTAPEPNLSV